MARKKRGRPAKWTPEKLRQVKNLYSKMPVADVAAKLGVTAYAIRNALHIHGIKKKARFWGADEESFILNNWREMDPEEIAKAIRKKFGTSRTKWAVINKYRELTGLRS